MKYPRIAEKIYSSPWAIKPSQHAAIARAFESHIRGDAAQSLTEISAGVEMEISDGIAIIPIAGVIGKHLSLMETACGGVDLDGVAAALSIAVEDENVRAIVLNINSGGGTVTGVQEISARIKAASETKPVIAYTDGQCCSAAYWMASQATAIYASPSAEVGSIGVYMALLDESASLAQQGVKVNLVKAGKFKASGAPFQPLTDDERAMFQADVDKIYRRFTSSVTERRPSVSAETMQGQTFDGEDSVGVGLTDGVADSIDEVLSLLR